MFFGNNFADEFSNPSTEIPLSPFSMNTPLNEERSLGVIQGISSSQYEEFLVELIKKEFQCSEKEANEYIEVLYSTREGRENIKYICEKYGTDKKQITKLKLKI